MTAVFHRISKFALWVIPVITIGATLLVASQPLRASAPSASAAAFLCTPAAVATFVNRVHVRCTTGGAPSAAIFFFAYCSAKDSSQASRFLSVFTTAKATGKNLFVFYDPTDLSGATCGCATGDCRALNGAEVQQ